jgi:phosphate acetyltransferase
MATFLDQILTKAKSDIKTIVLPEGNDRRVVEAATIIKAEQIANVIIIGDEAEISGWLVEFGANADDFCIINPETSDRHAGYAELFFELRKHKGVTLEQACETVKDDVYFATMMVKAGDADGLVAGACHSTGDTIRPALQVIKPAEGIKTISSVFFMCLGEKTYLFADCAIIEDPTDKQLQDIAISTAKSSLQFGFEPKVAMLSYSTKGSAVGNSPSKVARATERTKARAKALFGDKVVVDGEIQLDAAFVPAIAKLKCPDSELAGQANVFVFPDLSSGNITYKAVQRFANADAIGPMLQGLDKPVNDLSRGCSVEDVVATVALTAIQAQS